MDRLRRKKKSESRYLADLISAYGTGVLSLSEEDRFGLYLNIPRIRLTQAVAIAQGLAAYHDGGQRPLAWFDAERVVEEEVEAAMEADNLERWKAEFRARHHMGA